MTDRILFHEYGLQLRLGEDDRLMLNVLCGRVGGYGVEFPLNDGERENYRCEGDCYLQELGREVRNNPKSFIDRGRQC
jgi:hypothetical protein